MALPPAMQKLGETHDTPAKLKIVAVVGVGHALHQLSRRLA
jgi:hypothetical protein